MISNTLAKNLKKYRKHHGLTQQIFSEQLNISKNYLSLLENNKKAPSIDVIIRIANEMNSSIDDLLSDSFNAGEEKYVCELSQKLGKLSKSNKKIAYEIIEILTSLD